PGRSPAGRRGLQQLWRSYWRSPCDARRNRLVEAYQQLVEDVVRRFAARLPRTIDRGDLRTAANVGLMGAVASYDPRRGVRFESYCEMRVRGALLDELRSQDWLPRPWRQRLELQKRTAERLRGELVRDPLDDEMALAMQLSISEYESCFGTGMPGAPIGPRTAAAAEGEGALALDVVADARHDAPGERLTREELLRLVAQRLSEQEYRIVYLKYWEELAMREIGQVMGLSESRVCKIHAHLLERLKDRFRVNAAPEEPARRSGGHGALAPCPPVPARARRAGGR
ncbi:MAG: sigma-70 family RNA polymerase sigma factor, partial [Candidatus Rokubacteria bacterium]|nr:sigma-70 family RNA polymerase sigma factor [Candidatus Rokubacteria bacterium]